MSVMIMTAQGWRPFYKACVNSNQLEGVFRNISPEEARAVTAAHTEAFCKVIGTGSIRDIKAFRFPMSGAYGEKI